MSTHAMTHPKFLCDCCYRGCTYSVYTPNACTPISRPNVHVSGPSTHSTSALSYKQQHQAEKRKRRAETWGSSTQTRTHQHTRTNINAHAHIDTDAT